MFQKAHDGKGDIGGLGSLIVAAGIPRWWRLLCGRLLPCPCSCFLDVTSPMIRIESAQFSWWASSDREDVRALAADVPRLREAIQREGIGLVGHGVVRGGHQEHARTISVPLREYRVGGLGYNRSCAARLGRSTMRMIEKRMSLALEFGGAKTQLSAVHSVRDVDAASSFGGSAAAATSGAGKSVVMAGAFSSRDNLANAFEADSAAASRLRLLPFARCAGVVLVERSDSLVEGLK